MKRTFCFLAVLSALIGSGCGAEAPLPKGEDPSEPTPLWAQAEALLDACAQEASERCEVLHEAAPSWDAYRRLERFEQETSSGPEVIWLYELSLEGGVVARVAFIFEVSGALDEVEAIELEPCEQACVNMYQGCGFSFESPEGQVAFGDCASRCELELSEEATCLASARCEEADACLQPPRDCEAERAALVGVVLEDMVNVTAGPEVDCVTGEPCEFIWLMLWSDGTYYREVISERRWDSNSDDLVRTKQRGRYSIDCGTLTLLDCAGQTFWSTPWRLDEAGLVLGDHVYEPSSWRSAESFRADFFSWDECR